MSRAFAVGDIHGCSKTLRSLLLQEIKITKEDKIYFLGDYIDRGPDSKGVVDFIIGLKNDGYNVFTLRGNHEQLFIDSENKPGALSTWIMNRGGITLESFGVSRFSRLKEEYKNFFNETQFYFETDTCIFVHAGLNFENEDVFEDEEAMLWIRNMKVDKQKIGNRLIVHGHTPTALEKVKEQVKNAKENGAVNIDTGCVMKEYYGLGFLSALEIETMQLYSVQNVD